MVGRGLELLRRSDAVANTSRMKNPGRRNSQHGVGKEVGYRRDRQVRHKIARG